MGFMRGSFAARSCSSASGVPCGDGSVSYADCLLGTDTVYMFVWGGNHHYIVTKLHAGEKRRPLTDNSLLP